MIDEDTPDDGASLHVWVCAQMRPTGDETDQFKVRVLEKNVQALGTELHAAFGPGTVHLHSHPRSEKNSRALNCAKGLVRVGGFDKKRIGGVFKVRTTSILLLLRLLSLSLSPSRSPLSLSLSLFTLN